MKQTNLYEQAKSWMYRNARPLELARWQFHFEGGSALAVTNALAAYQNKDGGFGHALESDSWNPNSSPINTFHAIELLEEIKFYEKSHPMIIGILNYLDSDVDFDGKVWSNVLLSNNEYPHAPWWHHESVSTSHHSYNPTAGLVGFSLSYADPNSKLYTKCMSIANEAVEEILKVDQIDMHALVCYIKLLDHCKRAEIKTSFDQMKLERKISQLVNQAITKDISLWAIQYVCKPSQFFNSPKSLFYAENKVVADYECEFIQNTVNSDGVWDVTWSWEAYPEEWALSKNWWKAHIAVNNMCYLRNFGSLQL